MKKKLLIGLGVSIFLVIGCSNQAPKPIIKNENNISIKRVLIDLDKEIKKGRLRGIILSTTEEDMLSIGNNDEVSFIGKEVFVATPIALFINGKLEKTIESPKGEFIVKGSKLKDGDMVVIKDKFGKKLIVRKVEKL